MRLPPVKKPRYLATFSSLELKRWILKIALDDCSVPIGTRIYETHEAGEHGVPLLR